ncbi:MAG: helix-turn-helix domain-containing protein [Promethearchaeota archaeon]
MPLDQNRIREILGSGKFATLEGEFESQQLECKRQPYRLDSDVEKLELAKDVAALANAKGGVIVIGYATEEDPIHRGDQIKKARPFNKELFDPTRYQQVLENWLWPPLHGLEIEWYQSASDANKGITAIYVPAAEGPDRPVLVAKTILDTERRIEILFGYCERKQDKVIHHSIQRLQTLIRDGSRLDDEMREGFQSLHSILERSRNSSSNEAPPQRDSEEFNRRLSEALSAVNLNDDPAFTLGAYSNGILDLRELFESRNTRLVRLLENPPELRPNGFNLPSGPISQIIEGRLRRVIVHDDVLLELHRDGVLIFATSGESGLCWGRSHRQQKWRLINQLALIETTFLFCKLAYDAFKEVLNEDDEIDFDLRILRMNKDSNRCRLELGPLSRLPNLDIREAPGDLGSFSIVSSISEDPAQVAFNLVATVYAWFGLEEDKVPYSKLADTVRVIDEDRLAIVDMER